MGSIAEEFERLVKLRDAGDLTPEEFETLKNRLVGLATDESVSPPDQGSMTRRTEVPPVGAAGQVGEWVCSDCDSVVSESGTVCPCYLAPADIDRNSLLDSIVRLFFGALPILALVGTWLAGWRVLLGYLAVTLIFSLTLQFRWRRRRRRHRLDNDRDLDADRDTRRFDTEPLQ